MKKVLLFASCLAIFASCGKKNADNNATNNDAAAQTEITTESITEAATEVVNLFADADKIGAKSFGLRQNENGAWELNLKDLDETGAAAGDLKKIEIASDAEIITLGELGTILGSALNADLKSALNNKMVGYWLNADGKISHLVEVAQ